MSRIAPGLFVAALFAAGTLLGACSFIDDYDRFYVDETGADMGAPTDAGDPGDANDVDMTMEDGGPPPLTFETFLPMFFDRACARTLRCERKLGLAILVEPILCNPALAQRFQEQSLTGDETFDPAQAEACLAFLQRTDCSVDQGFFGSACEGILEGPTVEFGERCLPGTACAGRCIDSPTACNGICMARGADGAACTRNDDCNADLVCRGGLCQAEGGDGDVCEETSDCGSLLWCGAGDRCEPLPDSGDDCSVGFAGDPCRGQLFCVDDGTTPGPVCGTGGSLGQACSYDEPCELGLRCSMGGECVTLSPPGGSCVTSESCPAAFACVDAVCVPWGGIGDACDPLLPCILGACVGGTCAWITPGDACNPDPEGLSECEAGCEETAPGTGICNTPAPLGTVCAADTVCEGELLEAAKCLDDGSGTLSCQSCR